MADEPLPARRALVLYGSETGTAQDVAEELARLAQRLRFSVHLCELNAISLRQLLSYSVVLIAISTTGQGELPANSQLLWKSLRSTRLRPGCLHSVRFASFGLGDTSYPKFNFAHRKLYNRIVQLGAQPLCDRGESDEQHPEGVDGTLIPWSLNLRECLLKEYPLPTGVAPIPDNVLLRPKWELQFVEQPATCFQEAGEQIPGEGGSIEHVRVKDLPPVQLLPIQNGLTLTVESIDRVTSLSHWQDVRHLKLTSEPVSYQPGDVLTIYPQNFPSDVENFLAITKWSSIADVPIKFVLTSQQDEDGEVAPPLPNLPPSGEVTLRQLLTNYLDIMAIPRRSFFAQLAYFTDDETQKERLLEFTDPEYLDELFDYTTRPRRSILEVLQEFETVKLPWQRICSILPSLRGRQFSIASGGSLKGNETQTKFELLIAIVKYRTVIKRIRQGVCTRYIASLRAGQQLNVTLQKGSLVSSNADYTRPVVLVGPGTGLAPVRALIYERLARRQAVQNGDNDSVHKPLKNMLFFGCRNETADYFFKDEWASLSDQNQLDINVAFSRDQREKVYVQDLIRRQSKQVYDALVNELGMMYVCGSSGKMPDAVREALISVFQSEAHIDRKEAEAYLANLEKSNRYKQETW